MGKGIRGGLYRTNRRKEQPEWILKREKAVFCPQQKSWLLFGAGKNK